MGELGKELTNVTVSSIFGTYIFESPIIFYSWLIFHFFLNAYMTIFIIRAVLDWILLFARNYHPRGLVYELIRIVYYITEPPLRFIRRLIPSSMRLGGISLDLSFMIFYFLLIVLEIWI